MCVCDWEGDRELPLSAAYTRFCCCSCKTSFFFVQAEPRSQVALYSQAILNCPTCCLFFWVLQYTITSFKLEEMPAAPHSNRLLYESALMHLFCIHSQQNKLFNLIKPITRLLLVISDYSMMTKWGQSQDNCRSSESRESGIRIFTPTVQIIEGTSEKVGKSTKATFINSSGVAWRWWGWMAGI